MNPGEIYLADIPEVGEHRIVIVSREELNRGRKVLERRHHARRYQGDWLRVGVGL